MRLNSLIKRPPLSNPFLTTQPSLKFRCFCFADQQDIFGCRIHFQFKSAIKKMSGFFDGFSRDNILAVYPEEIVSIYLRFNAIQFLIDDVFLFIKGYAIHNTVPDIEIGEIRGFYRDEPVLIMNEEGPLSRFVLSQIQLRDDF